MIARAPHLDQALSKETYYRSIEAKETYYFFTE
jgi:hypothetical protein